MLHTELIQTREYSNEWTNTAWDVIYKVYFVFGYPIFKIKVREGQF
jgi:hypothetical protein